MTLILWLIFALAVYAGFTLLVGQFLGLTAPEPARTSLMRALDDYEGGNTR